MEGNPLFSPKGRDAAPMSLFDPQLLLEIALFKALEVLVIRFKRFETPPAESEPGEFFILKALCGCRLELGPVVGICRRGLVGLLELTELVDGQEERTLVLRSGDFDISKLSLFPEIEFRESA